MKQLTLYAYVFLLTGSGLLWAQETDPEQEKLSYYEQRAREDAGYEQSLAIETEAEESDFWEDQQAYEKELKKRDRKAYRAYMKGKRDAYAEHYEHCDHHCNHGSHYYSHATFYYHGYYGHHYYRRPYSTGVHTRVRIGAPSVRLGIL
jgi:hypothetical protein